VAGESTSRKWQYSTDNGATWNDFAPVQTGATYTPPTADLTSRAYRAVVTYIQTDTSTISVATTGRRYAGFAYTGAVQSFSVPAGVTSATVELLGARGGQLASPTSTAGLGGRVQGVLTVTPSSTLYVYVGQTSSTTTAGYNGGGTGYGTGAGGGGATDVRTVGGAWNLTASLNARQLVAGGGGGAGGADGGTP
jgi:hypothetical protein